MCLFPCLHELTIHHYLQETWEGVPGVETDDIGFTSTILDDLEEKYCIDTDRVYATGKSQGGGFVGVLACDKDMSTRIAAFSPVSGAFYVSNFGDTCDPETILIQPCNPGRDAIPMLEFHGLADSTIPYYGGERKNGCLPTIPYWVQTWAELDGLDLENTTSKVPGTDENSTAVRYTFGNGTTQGLVTHIMDGNVSGRRTTRLGGWTDRTCCRATRVELDSTQLEDNNSADGCWVQTGHWTRLA